MTSTPCTLCGGTKYPCISVRDPDGNLTVCAVCATDGTARRAAKHARQEARHLRRRAKAKAAEADTLRWLAASWR